MKKIALLSNVTVDFLVSRLSCELSVYNPDGFNTWQQEVLKDTSEMYSDDCDAIFVLLYLSPYEVLQQRNEYMNILKNWLVSIQQLAERAKGKEIFVSSLDLYETVGTVKEKKFLEKCEAFWIEEIQKYSLLFPIRDLVSSIGRNTFYSLKSWYLSSSPYSLQGLRAVAGMIWQYYVYLRYPRKKCLALDLDGTLWGGVVGEDGPHGIVISNHGEGAQFYDFQKIVLEMRKRGVILIALSKNNMSDVDEAFEKNPYMLLKKEDFVFVSANWEDKPLNLRNIIKKINIGLDSVVFFDDNPVEREQMKALCPEVTVVDFPEDTSKLPIIAEDIYNLYFKQVYFTDEDCRRTEQYRSRACREAYRETAGSMEDYLRGLEMQADIHRMIDTEEVRVLQLVGKTNQFNLTSKRYNGEQIHQMGLENDAVVAKLRDKFGDEGIVAWMLVKYIEKKAYIDSFLMSCRVMGRRLEYVLMSEVVRYIQETKPEIDTIVGLYHATSKNQPVVNFYDAMNFLCIKKEGSEKIYELQVKDMHFQQAPYKEIIAFGRVKQKC